jgi:circadian clock protein KaiB
MSIQPDSSGKKKPARKRAAPADGNRTAEFEALLHQTSRTERYELSLYVTGTSPRSSRAIANVRSLCEEFLAGRYDLQVIDIFQQPTVAATEQIIAAPTLIRRFPEPLRRLIGDLSSRDKVIVGLNLAGAPDPTTWAKI